MELDEPWGRIVAWLQRCAPATAALIRPPAPPAELAAARAAFARPWPPDLVRFYELCDGVQDERGAEIIPMAFRPVPVATVVPQTLACLEILAGDPDPDPDDYRLSASDAENALAGTIVAQWVPSYLFLADDHMAHAIVVDLRGGPQSGLVFEWMREDVDQGPRQASLTLLFDEIATCLETGAAFDGTWVAVVGDGGRLEWQPHWDVRPG